MFSTLSEALRQMPPGRRQWTGLSLSLVAALFLCWGLFSIDLVRVLEWKIVDSWIHKNGDTIANEEVAVIGIDDEFIEQFEWPIDKNIYGDVLFYLAEMGAKVIGVDVLFSNNLNLCDQGDAIFRQILMAIPNVVVIFSPLEVSKTGEHGEPAVSSAYSIGAGSVPRWSFTKAAIPYPEILETGVMIAHHNLAPPYRDGSYRQLPMLLSSGGRLFPTISLKAVSLFKDSAAINWNPQSKQVTVDGSSVPLDEQTNMLLDFRYRIPRYRLIDVYASIQQYMKGEEPDIGQEAFAGKIVYIGASDPLLGDNALTPMASKMATVPKVMLHARSSATLLGNTGIRTFGRTGAFLFSLGVLFVLLIVFKVRQVKWGYGAFVVLILASYFAGQYLYQSGYLLHIAEGAVAGLMFTLFASLLIFYEKDIARNFLFDSFGTYLSKELINDMYVSRAKPQLGGDEGIRTAFFTDIQSFSTFSEKIGSPTRLVELLNEYLTAMTDILMQNLGTLDKYEGDAIIAFFGAPMEMPDHAYKACRTGLEMQEKLAELRELWKSQGDKWPEIVHHMRMRIGVNTGPLVTGNMGSKMRMNYTMMGDTVNLAARLESGAKQYGVYTLISEETMKMVEDKIHGRLIDIIRVVGKSQPVKIYEILCLKENITPELKTCVDLFNQARELYSQRKWEEALQGFKECLKNEPHHPDSHPGCKTTPSQVYIQRCESYSQSPPSYEWDGVYTATEK